MKGDLIIYKCDYPDFDPNVVQKWEESKKKLHYVSDRMDRYLCKRSER